MNTFERNATQFYRAEMGRSNFEALYPDGVVPVLLGELDLAEIEEIPAEEPLIPGYDKNGYKIP